MASSTASNAPTFFITDPRMMEHKCEWNQRHVESPERLKSIIETLERENILEQCKLLDSSECSIDDLRLIHSQKHLIRIQQACELGNHEKMEDYCKGLEDIYINEHSWKSMLISAGSAVKAMEAVLNAAADNNNGTPAPNSFAAIRPPGHHASMDTPCGFCLVNNVAICAKKARAMGIERVLIVDWDIHAAQGTQYCVNGDPGIKLISIHRYEHGQFWPELPECGIVPKGNNSNTINLPLNEIGYGDAEYAAFMHFLVLPLIHQWQPGLILVSCGFDAALGDPLGEMEISPAGYGYMTGLLCQTGIPLCLLMEGGYFLQSVAQGALFCMRALIQKAPPVVNFCHWLPSASFLQTLYSTLSTLDSKFPLFNVLINQINQLRFDVSTTSDRRKLRKSPPIQLYNKSDYLGDRKVLENAFANNAYQTRDQYPPREKALEQYFLLRLQQMLDQYAKGPIQRVELDLYIEKDGKVLLQNPKENTKNGYNNQKELYHLNSTTDWMFFYYFLLLPLDFTFFNVRIMGHKLPLTADKIAEVGARLKSHANGGKAEMVVMNGGYENGGRGHENGGANGHVTNFGFEHALDLGIFMRLKPFFLF